MYDLETYQLFIILLFKVLGSGSIGIVHGEELPVLIWWTDNFFPHPETLTHISCSEATCVSTTNKKFQNKNSTVAVLFYGTFFNTDDLPFPRQYNHEWALLHEESPMNNYIFSHLTGIQLFNYTATFSRYSDYPLTTQFISTLGYLIERKPLSTQEKNNLRKKGLAPILYVQSHCYTPSDRDRYIEELMKYIHIDSYGTCLHNKDFPPMINSTDMFENEVFLDFIAQYKFHIAFENAICDDYITEKLFRPLHVGSIPIYKGSPSVKDWMPSNNSIIVADDFESPKDLARFILQLDEHDEMYDSFLKFKNENGITNKLLINTLSEREWGVNDMSKIDFISGFECYVCNNIAKRGSRDTSLMSMSRTANRRHMNCPQPRLSLEIDNLLPLTDEWMQEDWVENYWFAYDQAKAIQDMIENKETNSSKFMQYLLKLKYKH